MLDEALSGEADVRAHGSCARRNEQKLVIGGEGEGGEGGEDGGGDDGNREEECAFAYRVRRFHYYLVTKLLRNKGDMCDGAMFSSGSRRSHQVEHEWDAMQRATAAFHSFEDTDMDLPR